MRVELRGMRMWLAAASVALCALAAPAVAGAKAFVPKGLLDGAAKNPSTLINVIVVAEPGFTTAHLKNKKSGKSDNLIGSVRREYSVIPALAVEMRARATAGARLKGRRSLDHA